jgi:hypothetical protein
VNGKKRTPRIVDGINVKRRNSLERAQQIKGEALSLLLASNANVPVERRVTPKAAYEVVWRSLNSTRYEDFKVRRELALNELDTFLRGAHGDLTLAAESAHRDLFSVSHPLSLSLKRFAVSENSIVSSRISWLSADSTFDDSLRPLVASALGSDQTSPEYVYAVSAIRAAGFGEYFEALVAAAYGGGNSFWERSMRARRQRRHDDGRFAFMGGGVVALISGFGDSGKTYSSIAGRTVGFDPASPDTIDIETPDGQIRRMPTGKTKGVKAVITDPRFPSGLAPASPSSEEMKGVIDSSEIQLLDAPAQWSAAGEPQTTADGDSAQIFNHDSGEFQIARVTKADGSKEFTIRRATDQEGQVGEKIGEGKSWADVNDVIKKDIPDNVKKRVKARLDAELGKIAPEDDLAEIFGEPEELDGDVVNLDLSGDIEAQVNDAIANGNRVSFKYPDSATGELKERVLVPSKVEFKEPGVGKNNKPTGGFLVSGTDSEGNFKKFRADEMKPADAKADLGAPESAGRASSIDEVKDGDFVEIADSALSTRPSTSSIANCTKKRSHRIEVWMTNRIHSLMVGQEIRF